MLQLHWHDAYDIPQFVANRIHEWQAKRYMWTWTALFQELQLKHFFWRDWTSFLSAPPLCLATLILNCSSGFPFGCLGNVVRRRSTVSPHRNCVERDCMREEDTLGDGVGGVDWHSQLNNWVSLRWQCSLSPQLISGSSLFTAQLFNHTFFLLFLPFSRLFYLSSSLGLFDPTNKTNKLQRCQCICMYWMYTMCILKVLCLKLRAVMAFIFSNCGGFLIDDGWQDLQHWITMFFLANFELHDRLVLFRYSGIWYS